MPVSPFAAMLTLGKSVFGSLLGRGGCFCGVTCLMRAGCCASFLLSFTNFYLAFVWLNASVSFASEFNGQAWLIAPKVPGGIKVLEVGVASA